MIPNVTWEPPEVFSKGATITGRNFRNTRGAEQAIGLNTTEPIKFRDCKFLSNSNTNIMGWGGSNAIFENCEFYADPAPGQQYAKINIWQPKSFVLEHCYLEHHGGILIEQWQGELTAPLLIRYNKSLNVDKRRGDGSTGDHRAFIQLSGVRGLSQCEISWNHSLNEPGKSYIEDNINIYNSRGASETKPIWIHNNLVDGAYPFDLKTHFTGSGITADGDPGTNTADKVTAFILAEKNHVIRCMNAGMNIAAGRYVRFINNDIIASGMLPDGTYSALYWGAAAIWNGSNVPGDVFTNNEIKGNRIGYYRKDVNIPFANRQDYVTVNNDVRILPTDNTHLPNPITKATEDAEVTKWEAKVKAKDYVIGLGTNGTVIPPTTPGTLTLKVGQTATGKILPVNAKGLPAAFKAGTAKATSSAATIVAVSVVGDTVTAKAAKVGKSTIIVSITTLGGKTISKSFPMEVINAVTDTPDTEASDFTIPWVIS